MSGEFVLWIVFGIVVIILLYLDIKVFHRKAHEIHIKEALTWSFVWISLALLFDLVIYLYLGHDYALKFLTGYLIEKSLSVDNLFVFLLIFSYFNVAAKYQHDVLFWGIIGALIMRIIFIMAGVTLINKFHWIIYVFGGFLILTAFRMLIQGDREVHPERNFILKIFRKLMPVTKDFKGDKFFIKNKGGHIYATPLFITLLIIETSDVIFALDSIPAILAITVDPFIVYTSNVFAILGLRALYFALAGIMPLFRYLRYGLIIVLAFVGVKMMISELYPIPVWIALSVVVFVLLTSVVASLLFPKNENTEIENQSYSIDEAEKSTKKE